MFCFSLCIFWDFNWFFFSVYVVFGIWMELDKRIVQFIGIDEKLNDKVGILDGILLDYGEYFE